MIVVDTNVIAYLWLPGQDTAAAEQVLRRDPEWCAPLLWRSELRSVLVRRIEGRSIDLDDAMAIVEGAEAHMQGRSFSVPSDRVLTWAARSGCSAYDCEFVVLAEQLRIPLVTNDRQLIELFPDVARTMDSFARP